MVLIAPGIHRKSILSFLVGDAITATKRAVLAAWDDAAAWLGARGRACALAANKALDESVDFVGVKLVVHAGCPESLTALHQGVSRAGRDAGGADAILFAGAADRSNVASVLTHTREKRGFMNLGADERAALLATLAYAAGGATCRHVALRAGKGCEVGQLQTAPLWVVFHSFRLMFRRAIISRNGLSKGRCVFSGTRASGTLTLKRR